MQIKNPSKGLDEILNKLTKYPVLTVDGKTAQTFSRHKKIRYLSHNKNINIKGGIISIPHKVKIKKSKNGYSFDIF